MIEENKYREIVNYISTLDLPKQQVGQFKVIHYMQFDVFKFKPAINEGVFEMNREELLDFLQKRNSDAQINPDSVDTKLEYAGVDFSESFYVHFHL